MISYFNWELYFIFYLYVQSLLQLGPNKQVLSDRPKYMVVLSIYIYIQNHTVVNLEQSIYDLNYKNKKNL